MAITPRDDDARAVLARWANLGQDFDPVDPKRMLRLKGKPYMTAQQRLIWFLRDQRYFQQHWEDAQPYSIHTELVTLDREAGFAQFKTTVRDALGTETVMYGSEEARDFPDYIEKASTKSMARALLLGGYGTAFAEADMPDPQERVMQPAPRGKAAPPPDAGPIAGGEATGQQINSIKTMARSLAVTTNAQFVVATGVQTTAAPADLTTARLSNAEAVQAIQALGALYTQQEIRKTTQGDAR